MGGKPRDPWTKTYSRVGWIRGSDYSVAQIAREHLGSPANEFVFETKDDASFSSGDAKKVRVTVTIHIEEIK